MKKVLFVIECLGGGGAEKVLTTIVKNLDRTKFEVTVLTVVETGVYVDEVKKYCRLKTMLPDYSTLKNPIEKMKYKLEYKFIYSAKTESVYKKYVKEQYDIEIAFVEGYATKLVGVSSNIKSRKIAWVHTDMEKNIDSDMCYQSREQQVEIYKKFNKILCVSGSVRDAFQKKFFVSPQIMVQYNPIDEKEILEKSKGGVECIYPHGSMLIGTVGRLLPIKGYMRLAKCAKQLNAEGYEFTIWIIGDGEDRLQLEQYIKINNLEEVVILLGFQKNPYQYLKQCNVFICSSYAEGFSTAATESIILGKPVFTVECAGMKELLLDSQCGDVVPNTDHELYLMLKRLVEGKYDLGKYQSAAKEKSRELSLKTRIHEIEHVLEA